MEASLHGCLRSARNLRVETGQGRKNSPNARTLRALSQQDASRNRPSPGGGFRLWCHVPTGMTSDFDVGPNRLDPWFCPGNLTCKPMTWPFAVKPFASLELGLHQSEVTPRWTASG